MSAAAFPHITICPPGPERQELTIEHFDRNHHGPTRLPVSADFDGEAWSSPGIAFEDYTRMTTQRRKQSGERRLPTPDWAVNDQMLRPLLVRYLETRARLKTQQPGSEKERLARAVRKLGADADRIKGIMQSMCAEYVALRKSGSDPARLKKLQELIENYDTVLRINSDPAAIIVGVVRLYYRVRLDSVGVAEELGLKPPNVRVILWRLKREFERMQRWRWHGPRLRINLLGHNYVPPKAEKKPKLYVPHPRKWVPTFDVEYAVRLFNEGMTYREMAKSLGVRTEDTVRNTLKRCGVSLKRVRKGKVDAERALKLFNEGMTYREMAKSLGVTKPTVRRTLQRCGVSLKRVRKGKVDAERAARLFNEGKTYKEIGQVFGVNRITVWRTLVRAGVYVERRNSAPQFCE